jgi:hypothetical protein
MQKPDLKPLAPKQKLAIDPMWAKAATAAVGAGAAVAGKFISRWVWDRYVTSKRKAKQSKMVRDLNNDLRIVEIETLEQHVIKTRKQVRITLKRRG